MGSSFNLYNNIRYMFFKNLFKTKKEVTLNIIDSWNVDKIIYNNLSMIIRYNQAMNNIIKIF
jgi:hypothetical protein